MEKTTTFPAGGKVELLKSVENLPYRKRIAAAAKLGRDHKKNPQLKTLINELRTVNILNSKICFLWVELN